MVTGLPLGSFFPESPRPFGTVKGVTFGKKFEDTPFKKKR